MNRIISSVFTASALIFGVFLPREEAVARNGQGPSGHMDAGFNHARAGWQEDRLFRSQPTRPIDFRP